MYTNEILARLQNGEKANDIAAELTASLNQAELEYKRQCEKANEENRVNEAINTYTKDLTNATMAFWLTIDPDIDISKSEIEDMSRAMAEDLAKEIKSMQKIGSLFKDVFPATPEEESKEKDADQKIVDFLRSIGL